MTNANTNILKLMDQNFCMIIGLTGTNQAGKGEAGKYLTRKGFVYLSHSDEIRHAVIIAGGNPQDRKQLQDVGNKMRELHGKDYWTNLVVQKIREKDIENAIVDSCRNPGEIERLRKEKDFMLIAIDAPIELRYERGLKSGRVPSNFTLEDFKQEEARENTGNPAAQQLTKVISMADHIIVNDKDFNKFYEQIDGALEKLNIILSTRV